MTLDRELDLAVAAARRAGDEVARMRREGLRYGRKEGWELVSEADVRAAEMLHEALTSAYPGDGWLSEEHMDSAARLTCDRVWVVDPIDGTREFLQGVPEYAVSVGLVVAGQPVLGVVYNPATGEVFSAALEGTPAVRRTLVPRRFDVLVGRGEAAYDEVPPLPPGGRAVGVGSVAYRLALIAAGRGHAVVSGYGRNEWDVAAGAALCAAAGLRVTDVLGAPLRFNQVEPYVRGLLVAGDGLHSYLVEHLHRKR